MRFLGPALSLLSFAGALAQAPRSPDQTVDGRVVLRAVAPEARSVTLHGGTILRAAGLAGDSLPFARTAGGTWELVLPPLPPDIYGYTLRIDGAPALDALNPRVQLNAGPPASELVVTDGRQYFDAQDVPHGSVVRHTYWSAALGGAREVHVYVPPGRDAAAGPLPLLVLLGGNGQRAHSWVTTGRLPEIADNLLAAGRMEPMLIAMPDAHAEPITGPATDIAAAPAAARAGNTARFERDLLDDLLPFLESRYRIDPDRRRRALAGLSLGAGLTDQVGLRHADRFASFGLFSGGAGDGFLERHAALFAEPAHANRELALLFLGSGRGDRGPHTRLRALSEALAARGIRHVFWDSSAEGHNWLVWRPLLAREFLPRLFRPSPP